jgi:hypothetical protein
MSAVNPFDEAEPWEVSAGGPVLAPGDYVCEIVEADDETASTKNPQIVLRFATATGSIKSWETYHAQFLGKIVSLYHAAGLEHPAAGEFDPADRCRITAKKINELVGRTVGIVVRQEEDNRPDHAGEMRSRVQGYLKPEEIDPAVATAAGAGTAADGPNIPF